MSVGVYGGYGLDPGLPYQGPMLQSGASYRVFVRPLISNPAPIVISANGPAAEYQASAERLFRDSRYEEALRAVQHAIVEDPSNGELYLFESQTLLAMGDYDEAARVLDYATRLLERSKWGRVVEQRTRFYQGSSYLDQLDKLAQFASDNPGPVTRTCCKDISFCIWDVCRTPRITSPRRSNWAHTPSWLRNSWR